MARAHRSDRRTLTLSLLGPLLLLAALMPAAPAYAADTGSLTGVARTAAGAPLANASVTVLKPSANGWDGAQEVGTVAADGAGRYVMNGLQPGGYWVKVHKSCCDIGEIEYKEAWYGATVENPGGRAMINIRGGETAVADTLSFRPASVSGAVTCSTCRPFDRLDSHVGLDRWDVDQQEWVGVYSDWLTNSASYQALNLYPGTYRASAVYDFVDEGGKYHAGEPFQLAEQQHLEMDLSIAGPDVRRVAGPDRFGTAVAVSKSFERGLPVLYIANGLRFPDALSAGAAAAHLDGSLLIVDTDWMPDEVRAEIERLEPRRVVVVGGPDAVSPRLAREIGAIPGVGAVERIAGVDRFETSRKIAKAAFGTTGAGVAYVTTGLNFPDAVAAGPAAAQRDAPVVLVNGGAGALDTATQSLLTELRVGEVFVLGAGDAVSPGIEAGLRAVGGMNVTREAGVDRFDTAEILNQSAFHTSEVAFLATGLKFPDALSAAAYAARLDAPILLAPPNCVYAGTLDVLRILHIRVVVLLGSEETLAMPVQQLATCPQPTP